jgi:hypothetical protein
VDYLAHRKFSKVINIAGARKVVRLIKEGRSCSQGDMKACISLLDTGLKTATGKNKLLSSQLKRADDLVAKLLNR